ncbi:uncharacterized protein A1O9_12280 [Exophiala aquamarina CBS 119918]|uniref:Leucine-rich repeat-containing protein 40 n=1 Tax=Exophiala aquamarina CBS 119918 TaxID=1182545 RepID=A0A072P7Q6_9EURO|nr:uncharacterized protein A1O9_12280 [Exophiala aquamarina CBS 119918]KEF51645.1 hypothetical protein A1O9_12280 [Exophiala aquamarina CBS 119918]
MDQDHGSNVPLRASIPRLSRLPMPRAMPSSDNMRLTARSSTAPVIHNDDLRKNSTLPRPAGSKTPLIETFNHSIKARYAWSDGPLRPRSVSPVRDALRDAQNASLDTTPPGLNSEFPVFEDGNENPSITSKDNSGAEFKERRRPRPSLSERTIETLSQISPCPSPVGRRPSLVGTDTSMPPPNRPASSMRESRPNTPAAQRPDSPSKRPFRPPGRMSPTKDVGALPPVVSPGNIYTPPKAFVRGRGSRIAKLPHESKRSVSSALGAPEQKLDSTRAAHAPVSAMKSKPTYSSKTIGHTSSSGKPSLASIFKDLPTSTGTKTTKLAVSEPEQRTGLLRAKTRGENAIAPSTPPSAQSKKQKAPPKTETPVAGIAEAKSSPRSSAALRETIAKAKAAKRKALEIGQDVPHQQISGRPWPVVGIEHEVLPGQDSQGLLRKRIAQAVTSGILNIASMSLKRMPTEVMNMYESDNSTAKWSEMVDLIKLIAADNEIDQFEEAVFPDYSPEDMTNDDEKTSQFGGLEHINMQRNLLSAIPIGLRQLERLQILNLSNNRLTNDAFKVIGQVRNLKELMLGENILNGILDFGDHQLNNLQTLDLHGNDIVGLHGDSFGCLRSLKSINLAGNKMTSIQWELFERLPLTDLNVSKNCLVNTLFDDAMSLPSLRVLDASHNSLKEIGGGSLDLPSLRSLAVNANRLAKLPILAKCALLQTLLASENELEELPAGFIDLKALKSADFAHNNIRTIHPEIALMEELSSLTLVGNPLREKKLLTMSTAEIKQDAERKLETQHEDADVSSGSQTTSNSNQARHKSSKGILDLSSQSLTTISPDDVDLDGSSGGIHTLKLSNNDLATFPYELLSHPALKYSLQSLDLSHNPLLHPTQYLTSELFLPSLKCLYIVSTGLTSLDALTTYMKAPALTELNISCHRLAGRVPWVRAWFPNCVTLLATDNWFNSIDTEGVRGLEVLDIRNNEIESLPARIGLFGNFIGSAKEPGKLKILEVSGNRFRVPRLAVVEKGSEAVLKDLRRMIPEHEVPEEWKDMV